MSSSVTVSVLVPAYNEEARIGNLLESVRASFRALDRADYEVIVCDNNSGDGTAAIARGRGAQVVFEPHNQIARARNTAARAARGEWLIFIDADSLLTPDLLRRTLDNLASGRICGGGARVSMEAENPPRAMRFGLGLWNTISVVCRWAPGSYIYCLRSACEEVGGFDERYYAAEEIGFSRRLKRWGRGRTLRFVIISDAAVPTSARKAEQFTPAQAFRMMLVCCLPGSLRRRDRCGFWYSRPPEGRGTSVGGRRG